MKHLVEQLLLPFRHLRVAPKHVEWLALANAGEYREKHVWFYPFKTRFLRRHALSDGLDLQIIKQKCWCGDGIWRGMEYTVPERFWQVCHKCGGTGIYQTKHVVLIRWLIRGRIFHEPSTLIRPNPYGHNNEYRETIKGLIEHAPVDRRTARLAFFKLLLRFEPQTFWRLLSHRFYCWRQSKQVAFRHWLTRVRMTFWHLESDEVPF